MNPNFKRWIATHFFRTWTLVVGWIVLAWSFIYRPDLLTWWLRSITQLIERVANALPYPWGDRFEVFVRTIGASVWLQIVLVIVIVRVLAWLLAASWRFSNRDRCYLEPPPSRFRDSA